MASAKRDTRQRRRRSGTSAYSAAAIDRILDAGDISDTYRDRLEQILRQQARAYLEIKAALFEKDKIAPPIRKLQKVLIVHHDMERFASSDLTLLKWAAGKADGTQQGHELVEDAISRIKGGIADLVDWADGARELKSKVTRNKNYPLIFWAGPLVQFWVDDLGRQITYRHDGLPTRGSLKEFLKESIAPIDRYSTHNVGNVVRHFRKVFL